MKRLAVIIIFSLMSSVSMAGSKSFDRLMRIYKNVYEKKHVGRGEYCEDLEIYYVCKNSNRALLDTVIHYKYPPYNNDSYQKSLKDVLNYSDTLRNTPLHYLLHVKDQEKTMVEDIVDKQYLPHTREIHKCRYCENEGTDVLYLRSDDPEHIACYFLSTSTVSFSDSCKMIELLLKENNGLSDEQQEEIMDKLISDPSDDEKAEKLEMLEYLLPNIDVAQKLHNHHGETLLYTAYKNKLIEPAKLLLKIKDTNTDTPFKINGFSKNLLHLACESNYIDFISLLLDSKKVDINIGYKVGYTPLYIACLHKNTELIKLLLSNGAFVNEELCWNHIDSEETKQDTMKRNSFVIRYLNEIF